MAWEGRAMDAIGAMGIFSYATNMDTDTEHGCQGYRTIYMALGSSLSVISKGRKEGRDRGLGLVYRAASPDREVVCDHDINNHNNTKTKTILSLVLVFIDYGNSHVGRTDDGAASVWRGNPFFLAPEPKKLMYLTGGDA